MDEKSLKTSWKQRAVILAIAILLLGSTVFAYMFIVLNGNSDSSTSEQEALIEKLTEEYDAKGDEIETAAASLSEKYFDGFKGYLSEVKAYNSATANSAGLEVKDLKEGDGKTLGENDSDYTAYYIGWCADGSIFDSSFNFEDEDTKTTPTSLNAPIYAGIGLIEGWNQGVIGMKVGGVRQITMSGELAYGDDNQVCGGEPNTPLKFIVMPIDDSNILNLNKELDDIYLQIYYAYYGLMM